MEEIHTSERPLCHDSSTSANDVGAAEAYIVKNDMMVMKTSNRDSCIGFIFDLDPNSRKTSLVSRTFQSKGPGLLERRI